MFRAPRPEYRATGGSRRQCKTCGVSQHNAPMIIVQVTFLCGVFTKERALDSDP